MVTPQPGEFAAAAENWHLISNKFPKTGADLALSALAAKVGPLLKP